MGKQETRAPEREATLFRFDLTGTQMDREGGRDLLPLQIWASNAREALKTAFYRHGSTRGFVSIDEIDPMPTHVRIDGEADYIHDLGRVAFACAMSLLAEQSGYTTHAEARAYLAELQASPEEISKRLLAEYAPVRDVGAEMARSLSVAAE